MSPTIGRGSRRQALVLLAALWATSVVALLAGCSLSPAGTDAVGGAPASPALVSDGRPLDADRIELAVGDQVVTATLADTPAAREFAATLPVTVDLRSRLGQAKVGELPHELATGEVTPVFDPAVGGLYYWAPDRTIAVFTHDVGPSIPAPGLVRLGAVDDGLDALDAGSHVQMSIRLAP